MDHCVSHKCVARKSGQIYTDEEANKFRYVPLRLLNCAHSVCEACLVDFSRKSTDSLKCGKCSTITKITDKFLESISQYSSEIGEWVNTETNRQLTRHVKNHCFELPLNLRSIGSAFRDGNITLSKPVEMVELVEDDEAPSKFVPIYTDGPIESEEIIYANTLGKIPQSAPEEFVKAVKEGVDTYCKVQKMQSLKIKTGETEAYFKEKMCNIRRQFSHLNSLLELAENQVIQNMNKMMNKRLEYLKCDHEQLVNYRNLLKNALYRSPQVQTNDKREKIRVEVLNLVGKLDSNFVKPEDEFKLNINNVDEEFKKSLENCVQFDYRRSVSTLPKHHPANPSKKPKTENFIIDKKDFRRAEVPKIDDCTSVMVSDVKSPDLFYIQLQKNCNDFIKFSNKLHEAYKPEKLDEESIVKEPIVGLPCMSQFSADKVFYRTVITKVISKTQVVVCYIDFGNEETVSLENLRLAKEEFIDFPIQAIPCSLANISPANRLNWSNNVTYYHFLYSQFTNFLF